jgi:hypothetical protein
MKNIEKYIVIPTKYLKYLSDEEIKSLRNVIGAIQDIRLTKNKNIDPSYIVCKESEPYAKEVWELILSNTNTIDEQMENVHEFIEDIEPTDQEWLSFNKNFEEDN